MRRLSLVIALLLLASPLWAKEIEGVSIEEKVVNQKGTSLLLNGAGIRSKFFFNIYIAELYLEKQEKEIEKIMAADGARRIVMHFLYDKVGKDKLVEGWNDGFAANYEGDALQLLKKRIDDLNAMFHEDMVENDVIIFDYLPGKGTLVNIKGKEMGIIEGKDFNDALLAIWLGKNPISSDLRKALLTH